MHMYMYVHVPEGQVSLQWSSEARSRQEDWSHSAAPAAGCTVVGHMVVCRYIHRYSSGKVY